MAERLPPELPIAVFDPSSSRVTGPHGFLAGLPYADLARSRRAAA